MVGADFSQLERFCVAAIGVADNSQVIPKRLERTHAARGEIEIATLGSRRPQVLLGSVLVATRRPVHHL